jgi:small subunit ribosomal protein S10
MELKNCYEIRLRYQSFDQTAADEVYKSMKKILEKKVFYTSFVRLPVQKKRITVLRSPHVNKKSREQLEIRLYSGLILLKCKTLNQKLIQNLSNLSTSAISLKLSFVSLSSSNVPVKRVLSTKKRFIKNK